MAIRRRFRWLFVCATLGASTLLMLRAAPVLAQSVTVGGLTATVTDEHGTVMRGVIVTLEQDGSAMHTATTGRLGVVHFPVLAPGRYAVLAEQLGFEPVRMTDVPVVSGGSSRVVIRLTSKPPPITTVEQVASNAVVTSGSGGESLSGSDLQAFPRRLDLTSTVTALSSADVPLDGRDGFVATGDGLAPRFSTLLVDGVQETLLRHPGLRGDAATTPIFSRDAVDQALFTPFGADAELPANTGVLLNAQTQHGGGRFSFDPWLAASSAGLGGRSVDNPGDSSATSIRAGLNMGGPIKHDTGSWFVHGDYQQLELPSPSPFEAVTGSDSGDALAALTTAAQGLHHDVSPWVSPTVRTWKGGDGLGRLDWRFGSSTLLAVRAAGAAWTEDNPLAGNELVNGAGSELTAHDASGAASLTTGDDTWSSETRIGVHTSSRDWAGAALPYTGIVGDALAVGGAATLPGRFTETGLGGYETIAVRSDNNTFKAGASVAQRTLNYSWLPGSAGQYQFGDIASFVADQGAFYQATRATPAPDLSIVDLAVFVEDYVQVLPQLQLDAGIRYEHESLPADAVTLDQAWANTSGLRNDIIPHDSRGAAFGPRAGFTWDASGNGRTTLHGDVGIVPGHFDALALAEAAQFDGNVTVRRATGTLSWPDVGSAAGTDAGQSLTLFNDGIHKPRSYKSDLSMSQQIGHGTMLTVSGAYRHTDYLLRRTDMNRVPGPVATGSDGRPIYGSLEQFGGLITPAVGSNRRFDDFDMVYGLTADGYTDYYEADATLTRHVTHGIDATLAYTYSRTTDNLPGQLSADPADQLSPFPDGLNGVSWDDGRSDLDIPHRLALTLSYTAPGALPWMVAARFRYRSGAPFTPGFRPGVDANGDGSGDNDPAFLDAAIGGMSDLAAGHSCLASQLGEFAARNSCRDAAAQSLDLMITLPLPVGARHVAVTLDGYNLAGTATGLFDHAAVLVDPHGTITFDGSGREVLPLIANPDFGRLLSRRGVPRQIWIGLRVEN